MLPNFATCAEVRVAQEKKGAHAVIIVDQESSSYTSETIQNLIVADDGYGEQARPLRSPRSAKSIFVLDCETSAPY